MKTGKRPSKKDKVIAYSYNDPNLAQIQQSVIKNNKDAKIEKEKKGICWANVAYGNIAGKTVPGLSDGYISVTNNNGEFEFNFKLPPNDSSTSQMVKQYSIEFYNPYYEIPEIKFELKPGEFKELGVILTKVISYSLNVNVQQIFGGHKGKILDGAEIFVLPENKKQ